MKITTETGLKLDIDENVFDDMELIDALAELEENPIAISKVVKMMFGTDGKKQLYDHCRNERAGSKLSGLITRLPTFSASCPRR